MDKSKNLEERIAAKLRKLIYEREILAIKRKRIEKRICEIDRIIITQESILDVKV